MQVWDAMCGTILSTGARSGAMMATLRCDHPQHRGVHCRQAAAGQLRHFNLSALVTDAFMETVRADGIWPLVFPAANVEVSGPTLMRAWSGRAEPVPCQIMRTVPAPGLWDRILEATYDTSEPGVLFVDRINALNNLWYREQISATNPCGEVPLPPYGACDLGSVNLTRFVHAPFTPEARFDREALANTVATAVRLLDNVIDASRFPLPQQAESAQGSRRIGLGITWRMRWSC
jgi:ribonucleoside-diphosphate reductase alpha chain